MLKYIKKSTTLALATTLILSQSPVYAQQLKPQDRPPQFVLLAFDGSLNIDFWKESRNFAKTERNQNTPLDFTYFISGVYWLKDTNYTKYVPPHIARDYQENPQGLLDMLESRRQDALTKSPKFSRGKFSQIGFGGPEVEVQERVNQVNLAFNEEHEIASHANGHFNGAGGEGGKNWDTEDWVFELEQFFKLIFNVHSNNKMANKTIYPSGNNFNEKNIIGFRAPLLGRNPDMYTALNQMGYKYDTSDVHQVNYWPEKQDKKAGLWNFPLAQFKIYGTKMNTLSMDYNFYATQSGAIPKPENKELYKKQMIETYMDYFSKNYYGNRAPIHIGHHFSKWNGGAYWEAMKTFATNVCGLAEVQCVTYSEYMNWLESLDGRTLKAYQDSTYSKKPPFAVLPRPEGQNVSGELNYEAEISLYLQKGRFLFTTRLDELASALNLKPQLSINGKDIVGKEVSLSQLRQKLKGSKLTTVRASLLNKQGQTINTSTLRVHDIGTAVEKIDSEYLEDLALKGDMSEAHTAK